MRVLIDGDAFPDIDKIITICKKYKKKVIIYTDTSHVIKSSYAKVITVSEGNNAVDLVLENSILSGDLVLTHDYGVAIIALSKKAYALNQYGHFYTNNNIDYLMEVKNINIKLRKNNHIKGPKKRRLNDCNRLIESIKNLIGSVEYEKEEQKEKDE